MNKLSVLFMFLFIIIIGWSNVSHAQNSLPDEPEIERDLSLLYKAADSYSRALDLWKTAEDINKWIAASFIYDKARAIKLSSSQRTKKEGIAVLNKPSEWSESKAGGLCRSCPLWS